MTAAARTLHVSPVNDAVEHDTSTAHPDCVCGPAVQLVETEQGDGWVLVHHALDGRETGETPA